MSRVAQHEEIPCLQAIGDRGDLVLHPLAGGLFCQQSVYREPLRRRDVGHVLRVSLAGVQLSRPPMVMIRVDGVEPDRQCGSCWHDSASPFLAFSRALCMAAW